MTQATINGNTYSDDGTSARDMLHGGHRTWFLPMVGDVTTVAGVVAGQAAQTAIDAVNAANGAAATKGTSSTSITVSAGTKTLSTQTGKQFTAGNYVTISRTSAPATMIHGVVTSYSGTTLVVEVAISAGSGTYTDWTIALSGPQGATGASGDGSLSYLAKTGAYTITAADKAKLIDCTSGTFSLSFQACATLGATWATWIKNSGTGVITLDPYGAETIGGNTTFDLYPGVGVAVQCNGTELMIISATLVSSHQEIHVRDQKASGVNGGDSVVGWQYRSLNTVVANTLPGASLSSDTITLPPGKYCFEATATARGDGVTAKQRLSLYNLSDSTTIMQGVNAGLLGGNALATVAGMFAITASKSIKLRHWIASAGTTYGLGLAITSGDAEVYADLRIWRIA